MAGDLSIKDPDAVTIDEPITWVAPTLTFFCREAQWKRRKLDMAIQMKRSANKKKDPFRLFSTELVLKAKRWRLTVNKKSA